MNLEKIFIFMITVVDYSLCQICEYGDVQLPGAIITDYENAVGPYTDTGCPLIKEDGEFLVQNLPQEKHKYVFHESLSDAACISYAYQKGAVPLVRGESEQNETIWNKAKDLAESRGGAVIEEEEQFFFPYAIIYTTITNKKVREISDAKRTITLDISLTLRWMDDNIYTYDSNMKEFLKKKTDNEFTSEKSKHIWKPNLPIYDLYDYKSFIDSFRMVSLKVLREAHFDDGLCIAGPMMQYKVEAKVSVYCGFDFSNYPNDESNCKMLFGGQSSNLRYQLYDPGNKHHNDESFFMSDLNVLVSILEEPGEEQTEQKIGLKINIQRNLRPYVYKHYIPCIIITLVSQCSFLIPLEALPGRVALVVTQLLTLTSLFIHTMVSIESKTSEHRGALFTFKSCKILSNTYLRYILG